MERLTTFGDLNTTADRALQRAITAAAAPDGLHQLNHPATQTQVARLVNVVSRCLIEATQYGSGLVDRWGARGVTTVVETARFLHEVVNALPVDDETPAAMRPPVASALDHTATALGVGLDLLVTHRVAGPDGESRTEPELAAATNVPGTLISIAASTTTALTQLLGRPSDAPIPAETAPHLRHVAARITTAARALRPFAIPGDGIVSAVTARLVPNRIPVTGPESPDHLRSRLVVSAARLRRDAEHRPGPLEDLTTSDWHLRTAQSMIACHLIAGILDRVADGLSDLHHPAAPAMTSAAGHAKTAHHRWAELERAWAAITDGPVVPIRPDPSAGDMDDLLLRLGRLAHGVPDWTPTRRAARPLAASAVLAPDTKTAATVALTALRALDAVACGAIGHRDRVAVAAAAGQVWQTAQTRVGYAITSSRAVRLVNAYSNAAGSTSQAVIGCGEAIQAFTGPAWPGHNEVALTIRRHTSVAESVSSTRRRAVARRTAVTTEGLELRSPITQPGDEQAGTEAAQREAVQPAGSEFPSTVAEAGGHSTKAHGQAEAENSAQSHVSGLDQHGDGVFLGEEEEKERAAIRRAVSVAGRGFPLSPRERLNSTQTPDSMQSPPAAADPGRRRDEEPER